ncbi:MAG: VOC family protein [Proteobacteria bacterium]|nr:VOC family protein [Pseudomonadota bacterium]MBI3498554.1 VOC family protein [Pseudomonadota bacterium]
MPMPTGITGIDHVVILAQSLEAARKTYQRLGFTLTPLGRHSKLDTVNHCVMLQEANYFELLSVAKPQPLNADFAAILEEREGLAALALKTEDARASVRKLEAAGLGPKPAVDFGRPVELPPGRALGGGNPHPLPTSPAVRKDARFTVVHLDGAMTPGGRAFLCQHHTRDLVWLPEYLEHANGALGLAQITLVAADPEAAGRAYGAVFGAAAKRIPGGCEVATGNAPIRVLSAGGFAEQYPGESGFARHAPVFAVLSLKVRSAAATARLLQTAGVRFDAIQGGVRVPSSAATGTVLEFLG